MSTFTLARPGRPIHAGCILMGTTEILDVAPLDLLGCVGADFAELLQLTDEIKATAPEVKFHWVTETGAAAKMTGNMTLQATDSFQTCPPLDIVLVGAYLPGYTPTEAELEFLRTSHDACAAFLTVCGGFLAPQLAGILAGKTATAPRFMVQELREKDPRTKWVERRWARDGKVWTSGALLNGLDMMKEFMAENWPELTEIAVRTGGLPVRDVEYVGKDGMLA